VDSDVTRTALHTTELSYLVNRPFVFTIEHKQALQIIGSQMINTAEKKQSLMSI